MKSIISKSLPETGKIAEDWLEKVSNNSNDDSALVVGLNGHLGSGKTAFVQAVADALGIKEHTTSPTFVLMKIYETRHAKFNRLVHIDAYRLEKPEELEALDFERLVADSRNLILIEWSDNVKEALPVEYLRIDFEAVGENERKITFGDSAEV